tara:strand:- start:257 stop:415 length:159 start_codon:yes stop_codon:yes gene_type:complete
MINFKLPAPLSQYSFVWASRLITTLELQLRSLNNSTVLEASEKSEATAFFMG